MKTDILPPRWTLIFYCCLFRCPKTGEIEFPRIVQWVFFGTMAQAEANARPIFDRFINKDGTLSLGQCAFFPQRWKVNARRCIREGRYTGPREVFAADLADRAEERVREELTLGRS